MTIDFTKWTQPDDYAFLNPQKMNGFDQFIAPTTEAISALYFNMMPYKGYAWAQDMATQLVSKQMMLKDTGNVKMVVGTSAEFDAEDFIITGNKSDVIYTYGGDDLVVSGGGDDYVVAGNGADVVLGGAGDDVLNGGAGDDWLFGDLTMEIKDFDEGAMAAGLAGGGFFGFLNPLWAIASITIGTNEAVTNKREIDADDMYQWLTDGRDPAQVEQFFEFNKKAGNDKINGGDGNDMIMAGRGSDTIDGGAGDDIIDAGRRGDGAGNQDVVTGGDGNDIFYVGSFGEQTGSSTVEMLELLREYADGQLENAPTIQFEYDSSTETQDAIIASITNIGVAAAGDVLGAFTPASGTIMAIADEALSWATGSDDSKQDFVEIMDFNPVEDTIALPVPKDATLEFETTTISEGDGVSVVLDIRYGLGSAENGGGDLATSATFARVHLATEWLAQFNVQQHFDNHVQDFNAGEETYQERANAFWTDLLGTAIDLGGEVSSEETQSSTVAADDDHSTGTIRLIGNTGPIIRTAADDAALDLMLGGNSGDVLIANRAYITPGAETDNGAATALSTIGKTVYGFGGDDLIHGTRKSDVLIGGKGHDTIYTFGSEDWSVGDSIAETVEGNKGDDMIFGGAQVASLLTADGGEGTDTFSFILANAGVTLTARADDVVTDADARTGNQSDFTGFEHFEGSTHDDIMDMSLHTSSLSVSGAGGDDILTGTDFDDVISGGAGHDLVAGGAGADVLSGGAGLDTLDYHQSDAGIALNLSRGTAGGGDAAGDIITGFENVVGTDFRDVVVGDNSSNVLDLGAGDDKSYGRGGDDTIDAGAGKDWIHAGDGHDTVKLGDGDDWTNAWYGNDAVYGGNGNDTIIASGGNDFADGGAGDDLIAGGTGNDVMRGGAGADTFKFREGHGNDVIEDFVIGTDVLFFSGFTDAQDAFLNWTVVGQDSVALDYGHGNSVEIQFAGELETFSDSFLFDVA